jgi:hypothetical protein
MTLKDFVKGILAVSAKMPNVHTAYEGSVYDLNQKPDIDFSAVVVTQGQHKYDDLSQTWHFNFIIFYVDKLTNDESNRIDVQSNAIIALHNIIRNVNEIFGLESEDEYYDTFTERFTSLCAGGFVTLDFRIPDFNCGYEIDVDEEDIDIDDNEEEEEEG